MPAVLAFLVLFAFGCESELTSPESSSPGKTGLLQAESNANALASKSSPAAKLKALAEKRGIEAGDVEKRMNELIPGNADFQRNRDLIRSVVDSTKYECGPTAFDEWANENIQFASSQDAFIILLLGIDQYPSFYSLIFENPDEDRQSFGTDGRDTRSISRTNRSVKRFWNTDLSNVQTVAMHGRILSDFDKVFRLVEVLFPDDTEESNRSFSQLIVDIITGSPVYENGDAPIFTLNAFAFEGGPLTPDITIPDKIVMGDGIMEAMSDIGYGDAAPQAILAHEFAHQIQFDLNIFDTGPEDPVKATRRTELMADAYAAYYLTHKRGATMNWFRVEQFMQSFFVIGDCGFTSPGHHGTPNQRLKAAKFGFEVAENAQRRSSILKAEEFFERFEDMLPELLEPDAEEAPAPAAAFKAKAS